MTKEHGSKTVSSRLPFDLWRLVDRMAANRHMNMNDYIRMSLETTTHYNQVKKQPEELCSNNKYEDND